MDRSSSTIAGGAWKLADPEGKPLAEVRPLGDEIERLVDRAIAELLGGDAP